MQWRVVEAQRAAARRDLDDAAAAPPLLDAGDDA